MSRKVTIGIGAGMWLIGLFNSSINHADWILLLCGIAIVIVNVGRVDV